MVYFNLDVRTNKNGERWHNYNTIEIRATTYEKVMHEFHRFTPEGSSLDDFNCILYTFGSADGEGCGRLLSIFSRIDGAWCYQK